MAKFAAQNKIDLNKNFNALIKNLSPAFAKNVPQEFFQDKIEMFLTCRKLSEFMRENLLEENFADALEEISLKAVYRSLFTRVDIVDLKILLSELPNILSLKYSIVDDILKGCLIMISKLKTSIQNSIDDVKKMKLWKDICELDYIFELLKNFETCRKNFL